MSSHCVHWLINKSLRSNLDTSSVMDPGSPGQRMILRHTWQHTVYVGFQLLVRQKRPTKDINLGSEQLVNVILFSIFTTCID